MALLSGQSDAVSVSLAWELGRPPSLPGFVVGFASNCVV